MKRLFFINILLLVFSIPSLSQVKIKQYTAHLSKEQFSFRYYALGIKTMVKDSVITISEPLFDYIVENDDQILVQMSIQLHDGNNKYAGENLIWACMSTDLKIRFVFPLGTEYASYDSDSRLFYYTTWLSESRYWYNSGVIDYDGNVICPAEGFNKHASVNGDTIVIREWQDRFGSSDEDDEDYERLCLTFISKKKRSYKKKITLSIPIEYSYLMDPCVSAEITENEELFYSAMRSLIDGAEKKNVLSSFKELKKSPDSVLSQFAKDAIRDIRKM